MACCEPCDPNSDIKSLENSSPNKLVVAAVLIDQDNKILIAKRPKNKSFSDFWEFPGGKVNKDEALEIALVRELKEEINIDTCPSCLYPLNFISHRYENFHLIMPIFTLRKWKGFATAMEGQELKWIKKEDLANYKMPPANKEIIQYIIKNYI
jgi:8-oxo-dGTP diphosphatase